MRILGVDPGTLVVGFGCLEHAPPTPAATDQAARAPMAHRVGNLAGSLGRDRVQLVRAGVLRLGRAEPVQDRLGRLADEMRALIASLAPDGVALEEAYFGKSVQSALRLGEARGVILAEASRAGIVVEQFAPARVKRAIAGAGAATKERVAAMVAQALRLGGALPADATDALAVGLCCLEARRVLNATALRRP
ncbi:MAG: crossover junction endodeoxyribonuclease RuvC [Planctomycetes bacterium]|nr:crossover junction endodeoxyribonuclease RuvC [Planctomycetota bacterium]MCB9870414.1 crossover junction endodeoxyribonuclease RuvC [Planctomycetota bacterium]MCB9889405.1 crossover junction endodeoxyribonuclease RuvC [Planctomycetota bacterium]